MSITQASLNWITFSEEDIKSAREVLKNLTGESTVDSLGLGVPFEQISDLLFPATSTLHTRLRYQVFIVGIIYKMLSEAKDKGIKNPADRLKKLEYELQQSLMKNEKKDVIGRISQEHLNAWPSRTYWGALNHIHLFGPNQVSRAEVFEVILRLSKPRLLNDDHELEGDEDKSIYNFSEFNEIMMKLFDGNTFRSDINFNLTKEEARFLKSRFQSRKNGEDSLLFYLLNKSELELSNYKSILSIRKTNNTKLDSLLDEAKRYSKLSMGIMFAYRYALSSHRANDVYQNEKVKRSEWNTYCENNIDHLSRWISNHESLRDWNIQKLVQATEAFDEQSKIDTLLIQLFERFQSLWREQKSAKKLAAAFVSECKFHESKRRQNKSHFINWAIRVPDHAKGLRYADYLFDYRFTQGISYARDLAVALRRRS